MDIKFVMCVLIYIPASYEVAHVSCDNNYIAMVCVNINKEMQRAKKKKKAQGNKTEMDVFVDIMD